MFRILLAIVLATIAFTMWGFVWYATVFDDIWQVLIGRTESELIELANIRGRFQFLFTVLISLVQVVGIYLILRFTRASSFFKSLAVCAVLSTLIVLPALGNTTLFVGTPLLLLALDYGHFFFGYFGIALVIYIVAPIKR